MIGLIETQVVESLTLYMVLHFFVEKIMFFEQKFWSLDRFLEIFWLYSKTTCSIEIWQ